MNSADILAAIEAAHERRERVRVEVPEWGCALWFPKSLTVAQQQRISAGVPKDQEARLMVSYVLNLAENEDGTKVFEVNAVTRAALEGKADMRVLARIMQAIGEATPSVDEVKNA